MTFPRTLAIALLVFAAATIAVIPWASPGQAASNGKTHRVHKIRVRAHAPACAVVFIYGQQTCYAPAEEKDASGGIPWAVSPDTAIKASLGLDLSQVSVNRMPSKGAANDLHHSGRDMARSLSL